MTPVSSRYAMAAAGMMLVSGALILLISQDQTIHETCAHPERLPEITRAEHYLPRGRIQGKQQGTILAWAEGNVPAAKRRNPIDYWSIRSARPPEIYERPIRFIPGKLAPELHDLVVQETAQGPLPVHILEDYTTRPGTVIAYAMIYGNDPTDNALLTHTSRLWSSITVGATPLSLLMVRTPSDRRTAEHARERALDALEGAWVHFAAACRS